jgi:undecaprenyl diphosphate synthase
MLPDFAQTELDEALELTAANTGLTLIMALSYSSRWEIAHAIKQIAMDVKAGRLEPQQITQDTIADYLCTKGIPDPGLVIRTSGEFRISNFLLYQLAYAELYFTPILWPDFRKPHLYEAIIDFQQRERRFGKTGKQIKKEENA